MPDSVYRVIRVIGSSPNSWEEAARSAIETAGHSVEDLRIATIDQLDVRIESNKIAAYRVRLSLSFRYHEHQHA